MKIPKQVSRFLMVACAFIVIGLIGGVIMQYHEINRLNGELSRCVLIKAAGTEAQMSLNEDLQVKVSELEGTIERLVKAQDRLEGAQPQLIEWVYKHSRISQTMAEQIVDSVVKTSYPLFLLALIKTESNFNPTAVSKKGAMGLGQIMPQHEKLLIQAGILREMRDVFNIPVGIEATEFVWEFKISEAEGNINKALALYLGVHRKRYINQILKDYFYLNYLCKKPTLEQKAPVEAAKESGMREEIGEPDKVSDATNVGETIYTVKEGDQLAELTRQAYGRSTLDILQLVKERNLEIENTALIYIGQKIIFPVINIGGSAQTPQPQGEDRE